jgi:hypothetical protein
MLDIEPTLGNAAVLRGEDGQCAAFEDRPGRESHDEWLQLSKADNQAVQHTNARPEGQHEADPQERFDKAGIAARPTDGGRETENAADRQVDPASSHDDRLARRDQDQRHGRCNLDVDLIHREGARPQEANGGAQQSQHDQRRDPDVAARQGDDGVHAATPCDSVALRIAPSVIASPSSVAAILP